MNLHIDFAAMVKTLPVMLNGMVGGMVVMLLICAVLWVLQWFGRRSSKKEG